MSHELRTPISAVVSYTETWSLIVGKPAQGSAVYIRDPKEAASALAQPALTVDPDQKRWIDRQLTDIPGAEVHVITVTPTKGAAYTTRSTTCCVSPACSAARSMRAPLASRSR
jgi:hypothetical protein